MSFYHHPSNSVKHIYCGIRGQWGRVAPHIQNYSQNPCIRLEYVCIGTFWCIVCCYRSSMGGDLIADRWGWYGWGCGRNSRGGPWKSGQNRLAAHGLYPLIGVHSMWSWPHSSHILENRWIHLFWLISVTNYCHLWNQHSLISLSMCCTYPVSFSSPLAKVNSYHQ